MEDTYNLPPSLQHYLFFPNQSWLGTLFSSHIRIFALGAGIGRMFSRVWHQVHLAIRVEKDICPSEYAWLFFPLICRFFLNRRELAHDTLQENLNATVSKPLFFKSKLFFVSFYTSHFSPYNVIQQTYPAQDPQGRLSPVPLCVAFNRSTPYVLWRVR